ncbi:V-type immunoglobulin domain-containing suppressor of T-cell activation-like [Polyodon spathula]|uniref:V-type immunoglobulin domain-containing suppressor of T-cell activation-like n=1 Tax=Polyodon spathula TaxID=7913 RepID=UPI001B7EE19E|nr:V-type immunoglobulin domain-containing suppressor of T-cell activation-like [Polyodon spathula]
MDLETKKPTILTFRGLLLICVCINVSTAVSGHVGSVKVTAPYVSFSCPEGANVTLKCSFHGHLADIHDKMMRNWFFSAGRSPQCREKVHLHHVKNNGSHTGVFQSSDHKGTFWVTLTNLTAADQGGYCCYVYDINTEHNKLHMLSSELAYIELNITKNGSSSNQRCISHAAPHTPEDSNEASTALGLATAGSILGVLSLPVILLLVYKQRQSILSNRRAHELVRMDSEALGHENPVFDDAPPPSVKTRSATQIMTRQSSETGRHLLSEPGTPLSPSALGDCFFPSQEPIPESPDLINV